ncbi:MAG: hypothetical protein GXX94_09475 [Chloroflexi bacterium]|nr:hypothetical protein [Chloroflexota bacterium]
MTEFGAYQRVSLSPAESRVMWFVPGPRNLALWDRPLEPVVEPGEFEVAIGGLGRTFEVHPP